MKFKLTIRYAGTKYSGWEASQPHAVSIQNQIERAIRIATSTEHASVVAAGRTDKGVHALGQVAHVEVVTSLSTQALRDRINDVLPSDIAVLRVERAHSRFDARRHATSRSYLYQLARTEQADAVKPFSARLKISVDVDRMRETISLFKGRHDFRSFCERGTDVEPTICTVFDSEIKSEEEFLIVHIRASRFLWKMTRRLVGVTVAVGAGRLSVDQAHQMLRRPTTETFATAAELTAAAKGLFLYQVCYEGYEPMRIPSTPIVVSV